MEIRQVVMQKNGRIWEFKWQIGIEIRNKDLNIRRKYFSDLWEVQMEMCRQQTHQMSLGCSAAVEVWSTGEEELLWPAALLGDSQWFLLFCFVLFPHVLRFSPSTSKNWRRRASETTSSSSTSWWTSWWTLVTLRPPTARSCRSKRLTAAS